MQNFNNIKTIIKKELRTYFNHPTAYILLVVFLAISYFFYFRPIMVTGETSLRPLFSILPWIMMFFVPAITMSLVAKEKDNNTMEILATQPISTMEILVGKALGAFVFAFAGVLITLTIPITLSRFGDFDLGIIFSQYLGSAFLVASFVTIGIWASSITKNQVVAFITAIAVNFALIFAGFEMVTIALSYPFDIILQRLSIVDHFYNISRGVIDLRDVVYFIALILIFGFLSYLALLKTKGGKTIRNYKKTSSIVIVIVIIALIVNLGGSYIRGRIDLTKGNIYTLSQATKTIISNLETDIDIEFFVNKAMPAQLATSVQDVQDLLNDYKNSSKGKINLITYYPDVDSAAANTAAEKGIPAIQFNVIAKDEFQTKKGYFGITLSTGTGEDQQTETIPFIEQIGSLEYRLTSYIYNFTNEDKKTIGFLTGHGEKSLFQDFSYINEGMAKQYQLETVELVDNTDEENPVYIDIPENIAVLVIAGPVQALSEAELGKINYYLSNGGSVLAMTKTVTTNPQYMTATSTDSNLNLMLNEWGVHVNSDIIYDLQSHESVSISGGMMNYILPYPLWPRTIAHKDNIFLSDIKSMVLPWGSSIEILENKLKSDTIITKLFTTTEFGGFQAELFNIDPQQSWAKNDLKEIITAVAIQNTFEDKNSRLIVVSNVDFATQGFIGNAPENAVLAQNAIEWLAQDDILSSIRAKNLQNAPLIFKSDKDKNSVKYFNTIGVPIIVIIAGAVIMWRRKKKMNKKLEI